MAAQTLRLELHAVGFNGRAVAYKPKITMRNAKRQLEWFKAHRLWTRAVKTRSLE